MQLFIRKKREKLLKIVKSKSPTNLTPCGCSVEISAVGLLSLIYKRFVYFKNAFTRRPRKIYYARDFNQEQTIHVSARSFTSDNK